MVGAGPGSPELLTLLGLRRLTVADVVVHDKLVDPELIELAPAGAERIFVGKDAGRHCVPQSEINELLIDRARAGRRVVRLKGGDPLLFARGGEEARALASAGVAYEIVPGVTAAQAAAATAGMPLTDRTLSSAVAFVTGHEDPEKSHSLDWRALAQFPGTIVVYMGLSRIDAIARALVEFGKDRATPVALVEWGGSNRQRVQSLTLGECLRGAKIELRTPVVAILGAVAEPKVRLDWFERRPLSGKTVLVLRPPGQSLAVRRRLEDLGARVLVEPAMEIQPPDDWTAVDRAIDDLNGFDWVVFSSRNGVESFLRRLFEKGRDARAMGPCRLAAIGPGTAAALREYRLSADLVPKVHRAEGLAEALLPMVENASVLLVRADRGRTVLEDVLKAKAREVRTIAVYRQADRAAASAPVLAKLVAGGIDWVLLSSSNIAATFARWLDEPTRAAVRERVRLATISPVTTRALRAENLEPSAEAAVHTMDGMIDAILAAPDEPGPLLDRGGAEYK